MFGDLTLVAWLMKLCGQGGTGSLGTQPAPLSWESVAHVDDKMRRMDGEKP
jgi:hypothetical protein